MKLTKISSHPMILGLLDRWRHIDRMTQIKTACLKDAYDYERRRGVPFLFKFGVRFFDTITYAGGEPVEYIEA